jgi:outer membrane lipopolysaccharide assembly protein LptE/RlpB
MLNYNVHFVVTNSAEQIIFPEQMVMSSASYVLNSTEVSGFTEQPQLLFGLQQDIVFQIMSRLSSNNAQRFFLKKL